MNILRNIRFPFLVDERLLEEGREKLLQSALTDGASDKSSELKDWAADYTGEDREGEDTGNSDSHESVPQGIDLTQCNHHKYSLYFSMCLHSLYEG